MDLEQQQQPQEHYPPQQQHTDVVPPSGEQYAVPAKQGGGESANEAFPSGAWVKRPRGILRLFEWLFSIIAFACMADIDGYGKESKLAVVVAIGVLVFIYTTVLIVLYTARGKLELFFTVMPIVELMLDGCFCVLLLAAGAASATWANEDIAGSRRVSYLPSGTRSNLEASIVFTFFTLLCMIASTVLSFRENAKAERSSR